MVRGYQTRSLLHLKPEGSLTRQPISNAKR